MKFTFCIFLFFSISTSYTQEYFQQEVNNKITIELFPEERKLDAHIEIEYINNSQETLKELYFHLWPNAYSSNETALSEQLLKHGNKSFFLEEENNRGSIQNLTFKVDGISVQWSEFENHADIAILQLNEEIQPGESVKITTPFEVMLPSVLSRMGVENGIFHLTQWFPKPAVYDHSGWHPMPYLDQGEFYSEFGSYDVSITVPGNFVVAATGVLQNLEEIQWLRDLSNATKEGIENGYEFDRAGRLKQRHGKKTLHYQQDQIHDFAIFASDQFLLLEDTLQVKNNEISIQSFFPEEQVFVWEQANQIIANAINFMSEKVGEYAYDNYKAVAGALEAGGGMEYPMVTVLAQFDNDLALKKTLTHEVIHTWFQAVLANNERDHAWLDEGLTSFYTEWALANEVDVDEINFSDAKLWTEYYLTTKELVPVEENAQAYHPNQYGLSVYGIGAKAINYLREYLGDEQFDQAMKSYYETWKFKHPGPKNLQESFENAVNLDWFFKDLIVENQALDYQLKSVKNGEIIIENQGDLIAPFTLDYLNEDGEVIHSEWMEGFEGEKSLQSSLNSDEYSIVEIFHRSVFYEADRSDNARTVNNRNARPLKVFTPLSKQKLPIGSIENKELYVSPIVGWNAYDRWMIGATISNTSLLKKPFEYQLMPMYATNTKLLTGLGEFRYHGKLNSNLIEEIEPYARVKHFSNETESYHLEYFGNEFGVNFKFRNKLDKPNFVRKELDVSTVVNLVEPIPDYDTIRNIYIEQDYKTDVFFNATYTIENARYFNPNKLKISTQVHEQFAKISATYDYRYDFKNDGEFLKFRAFAGSVIASGNTMPFQANFSAIGRNGQNDYDFSGLYFYRNNSSSLLNNAWMEADGALKTMQNDAQLGEIYGDNMFALNTELVLPVDLPLGKFHFFGDVAMFSKVSNSEGSILYDSGVSYHIGELVEIYYPLLLSDEFKPVRDIEQLKFTDKLIFKFQFNPLDIKQKLRKKF